MLKAIRDIGELFGKVKLYDEVKAETVLVLEFDERGEFLKADLDSFDFDNQDKYLYRKVRGNDTPVVPTLKITVDKREFIKKASWEKLKRSFEHLNKKGIFNFTLGDMVLNSIKDKIKNFSKPEEEILITAKIDGFYLGELSCFREYFKNELMSKGKESLGIAICSVCLQEKEVSGNISPFSFYTIDKPGYITGGFRKEIAYKNFPLCYECRDYIRAGRKVIENNLKFSIGKAINYYLIPEFILGRERVKEETLSILFNPDVREIMLTREERKYLMSDEKEILEILSDEKDVLTLNFLFLESDNSAERILLLIQDVYPSRLRELFEAQRKVEKLFSSNGFSYTFNYYTIYKFFSKSDSTKKVADLRKYFLEILDKTFRGVRIDEKFLLNFLMKGIRDAIKKEERYKNLIKDAKKEEEYKNLIKDALSVFVFAKLTTKEVDMEVKDINSLEEFLENLPILDTNLKKGLFLLGALTERLLQVQKK